MESGVKMMERLKKDEWLIIGIIALLVSLATWNWFIKDLVCS
jgi:hypothetical protein